MKFELPVKSLALGPVPSTWRSRLPSSGRGATIFMIALFGFAFFRHYILEYSDPWKCQALLDGGHWYDDHVWITEGCDHVWYGSVEIGRCASQRSIVFAGDEVLQGLFWAVANKLNHSLPNPGPKDEDFTYEKDHVRLEFLVDPYLNGSKLMSYVETFEKDEAKKRPVLLVVGPSQWHLDTGAVEQFVSSVNAIAQASYHNNPRYGWTSGYTQKDGPGDMVLFSPAQEPPEQSDEVVVEAYRVHRDINDELRNLADEGTINLMTSFKRMTDKRSDKFEHKFDFDSYPSGEIFARRADTMLNLRCNAHMVDGGTNIKTCCGTWAALNWQQVVFFTLGMLVLPLVVLLDWRAPFMTDDNRKAVRAFSAFTGTVSLQYITDRTHIFEQVKRLDLHRENLYIMIAVILIAGLVTLRKSPPPKKPSPTAEQPDQPFLPRDQTEEWKGWMQALIIAYHMNRAWTLDWFWMLIRMCVASYLFLTGFGHTVYFLQKRDFSFKRFAAVMLRTNLLPVTLAFALRTTWLKYYYMPLSSFWYLVVYLTMSLGRGWNARTPLLLLKIAIAAATVHFFLRTRDLPEAVVSFFHRLTRISFDAGEFFHHRVEIDHYITFVGMLAGILYVHCKEVLPASSPRQDLASRLFRRAFPYLKHLTVLLSAVAMVISWYKFTHWSQPHWTSLQPVATIAPILAFTVLRNAHPLLRNHFSLALAWLGKYSGEMYVMQNHVWLAGDQEAVLRTGLFHGDDTLLGDRWRDLLFTTPLYLIACCIIGDSTAAITAWFCAERKAAPATGVVATATTTGAGAGTTATTTASASGAESKRVPEVEMALLSARDGDDELPEEGVGMAEKPLPRIPGRWERLRARVSGFSLWPASVGNRAVVLLVALTFLNWTYH